MRSEHYSLGFRGLTITGTFGLSKKIRECVCERERERGGETSKTIDVLFHIKNKVTTMRNRKKYCTAH